jgi:hypothetical protein
MAMPAPSHAIADGGTASLRPLTRIRTLRFGLSLYVARAGPEKVGTEARAVIAAYERPFLLLRRPCAPVAEARRTTGGRSAMKPVRKQNAAINPEQYGSSI